MKLIKRCGLLATAAASLALSLSTFSTSTSAALIIELSPLEVRAAKDADPFVRELEQEEGPQSLVLSEENLFVSATGVAKTGPGEEDFVTNGTLVEWYIDAAGTKFEQVPAEVGANGEVVFLSDFGVGDAVNWIHVKTRGDNTIKLVVFGDFSNSTEATVFTISDFESVFPLLALIVLSLLSRNVYISMFFGIWFGSLVIEGGDIAESFRQLFDRHMIPTLIDEYNFRTITFALFLAGFIAMIKRSGGQDGFSDFIAKYATSPRRTQFAAVAAGVGLFFDDYSSALIIGSSFKKLTDRFHVSREKLAFVVDSTAAPIASMAPISSWIAFELSRIKPELDNIIASSRFDSKFDLPKEYAFFLNTIPSRYYPFYMLVLQVTFILAGVEFGPMLYTERKTRLERRLDGGDGATDLSAEADLTNPEPDTPRKAWNFFVPLGFFIVSLLTSLINIGKDSIYANNFDHPDEKIELNAREVFGHTDAFFSLVYTTIGSSLFCLVFYLIQVKKDGQIVLPTPASICMMIDCRLKKADDVAFAENLKEKEDEDKELGPSVARPLMQFTEGVNIWVEGFKNLVPAILILCMAFTIKSIVKGCATDRFFTDIILNGDLGAEYLPTIIFFVASLLSFSTGTSFGTMSIMFPLVSFATWEKSEGDQRLFTVAMSSIMAGAVFGDHSSLISDTTILSSIGSGCTIGTHVYTQLPYALWGALFAMILGTLPAGAGADAVTMLIIGGAILAVVTIAVSAPIVARNGRLDRFSELVLLITKSESLQSVKDKTVAFTSDPDNEDMIDPEPLEQVVIGVKYLISLVRGKVAVAEPIADAEAVKVVDATGEEASTPVKPAEATGAAANEVEGDMNKKMSL